MLIAIIHSSNEIGTIQPIAEVGKIARQKNIFFHVDAVQAVGHMPINAQELGVNSLSLSAHKFYGPKGVGALFMRKGSPSGSYILGGDQEKGRRASTQNVAGIVGLAKAIELCHNQMVKEADEQTRWRNRIIDEIQKTIDGVKLNGHPT